MTFVGVCVALSACRATPPAAPSPNIVGVRIFHGSPTSFDLGVGGFWIYAVDADDGYTDITNAADLRLSNPSAGRIDDRAFASDGRKVHLNPTDAPVVLTSSYRGFADQLILPPRPPFGQRSSLLDVSATFFPNGGPWVGTTFSATARYWPLNNAMEEVTTRALWWSEDPSIATVTRGAITGVRIGTTRIFASFDGQSAALLTSVHPHPR